MMCDVKHWLLLNYDITKFEANKRGVMKTVLLSAILIFSITTFAQQKTENDIDLAFQNAKKGIYWALANIPEKKQSIDNDLIADDKLYASVKLSKEFNGVKIESTGYYLSNTVSIVIYKSDDSLEKEGYKKKVEKKDE